LIVIFASAESFTAKGASELAKLKKLATLQFWNGTLTDEAVKPLMRLPLLESLNFVGCRNLTGEFLEALPEGNRLTGLGLNGTGLTDAAFRHLKRAPKLATLTMEVTKVTGAGFRHLEGMEELRIINCHGCLVDDVEGLATLAKLPRLTQLTLHICPVTDAGVKAFSASESLWSVDLIGSKVTDDCAAALASMKNLEGLSIWKTDLTDRGIAELAKSRSLTNLHCGGKGVTVAAVEALAERKKPWLDLWIVYSPLTDAAVPSLLRFKNLLSLNVDGSKITPEGMGRLRAGMPKTKVFPEAKK